MKKFEQEISNTPYIATSSTNEIQRQTIEVEASAYTDLHPNKEEFAALHKPRPTQKMRKNQRNCWGKLHSKDAKVAAMF